MPDKERFGRFLRALVGLLLVGWAVVALVVPPDPLVFTAALVPAWLLAAVAAAVLVYGDGYGRLRSSPLYAPGVPAARATAVFALLAVVLKVALTLVADAVLGRGAVGDAVGAGVGVAALALAFLAVFPLGLAGRVRARRRDR